MDGNLSETPKFSRRQILKTAAKAAGVGVGAGIASKLGIEPAAKADTPVTAKIEPHQGPPKRVLEVTGDRPSESLYHPERYKQLPAKISRDPKARSFVEGKKLIYLACDPGKSPKKLYYCEFNSETNEFGLPLEVAQLDEASDFIFKQNRIFICNKGILSSYEFGPDNKFNKKEELPIAGVKQLERVGDNVVAKGDKGVFLINPINLEQSVPIPNSQGKRLFVSQLDKIVYLEDVNTISAWKIEKDKPIKLPDFDKRRIQGDKITNAGDNRGFAIAAINNDNTYSVSSVIYEHESNSWSINTIRDIPMIVKDTSEQLGYKMTIIDVFVQGLSNPAALVKIKMNQSAGRNSWIKYSIIFYDPNSGPFFVDVENDYYANENELDNWNLGLNHFQPTHWPVVNFPKKNFGNLERVLWKP